MKTLDPTVEIEKQLSAAVRAGCFTSEDEALHEAMYTLFALKPHLRVEAAIRLFQEGEVSLSRAAEMAGMTRWRLQDVMGQRGIREVIEADPKEELEQAVESIRRRRE